MWMNKSHEKRMQQMQHLLHLKEIRNEVHVPSSNQFLVFIVKKSFKLKIQRFYQCKCHVASLTDHATHEHENYDTIEQILENGNVD